MIVDAKKRFLTVAAKNGNEEAMSLVYHQAKNNVADSEFHMAGKLYVETLIKCQPTLAIDILHPEFKKKKPTKTEIQQKYLRSIIIAAQYNFDYDHFLNCALWSKKGLDLYFKFTNKMSDFEIEKFEDDWQIRIRLSALFKECEEYFDQNEYRNFILDWEFDYFTDEV